MHIAPWGRSSLFIAAMQDPPGALTPSLVVVGRFDDLMLLDSSGGGDLLVDETAVRP